VIKTDRRVAYPAREGRARVKLIVPFYFLYRVIQSGFIRKGPLPRAFVTSRDQICRSFSLSLSPRRANNSFIISIMYLDNGENISFATLIQTSPLESFSTDGNADCTLSSKRDKRVVHEECFSRRILRLLGGRNRDLQSRMCV